ncbi:MAG: PEP-CTERM sorting domain-containing protein [Planctomycetia bacterium]
MRTVFLALAIAMIGTAAADAGVIISIANQTVNANSTFSVDVFASGTGATTGTNYFNLELQVVSASTATPGVTGQLAYTTPAGVPTFSNTNYLFYGDSFAETTWNSGAGSSSWSVSALGWTNDTYNFTDASNSVTDLSLTTSRYLTTLYFTVGGTASGDYQVVLGSSEFDVDATDPSGELPEYPVMDTGTNSGIFTVNGGATVPEPSTALLGGLLLAGAVIRSRRRAA